MPGCRLAALALVAVLAGPPPLLADSVPRTAVLQRVDARAARYGDLSRRLWELAEPGFQETKSAALLVAELQAAGFRVRERVADIPTAFVAEWGTGRPVVGIMGEYDALPGLSQEVASSRRPLASADYGHGCAHNLLGAGSALAAVAVKETLEQARLPGTIRFYGTPAEEGGDGKVYMARAGVFDDVDVVLHWHPGDRNVAPAGSTLAIMGARFRFTGQAAHAASAPDRGRSALDGLMLMAHAVDLLREHIPTDARLHYVVTNGGAAPNIVPSAAEMYLYARHPQMEVLDGIWKRVVACAEAGALGTGTGMQMELVGSSYEVLPNDALTRLLDRNLREVGGVAYSPEDLAFAEALRQTVPVEAALPLGSQTAVRPSDEPFTIGSTDAGDISWLAPTGWIFTATNVPGIPLHSWQATACAGHGIGRKGMVVAAKTLALTAIDLLTTPAEVQAARAAFDERRAGRTYRSRIPPDMKPPLDYRRRADR